MKLLKDKKVIVITDGDRIARKAVEFAAGNVGARCISLSAGNPTPITYDKLLSCIKEADGDIVVCMVDDKGCTHKGMGETILEQLITKNDVDVIGVVAVASNTENVAGIKPDFSITNNKQVVDCSVNKFGEPVEDKIYGDTVDVLKKLDVPLIVGLGDPGKMNGLDTCGRGAPITTMALKSIIDHAQKREGKA